MDCAIFSIEYFLFFQYNLVGGALGNCWGIMKKLLLFHELFVGGTFQENNAEINGKQWFLPPFFLENLRFSVQFGRGYPRKLLEHREKTMLFHELFVGGNLARQW